MVRSLDMFNAELSLEWYWRGPRSQDFKVPAGTNPRTSHHRSPGRRREAWKEEARDRESASDERTREGDYSVRRTLQSKSNVGETSERRGAARMGFSERIDTILN